MEVIIVEGKQYTVLYPVESEETVNDMELAERTDELFSKSTHWLCKEEFLDEECHVTNGKLYPFFYDEGSGEYFLLDDTNEWSLVWMVAEGWLLSEVEPTHKNDVVKNN